MVILRALISTARMIRHTPGLAALLPPDDEVLLDAPDERLAPALVAAGRGDHRPAAALLATTREAMEWESRDRYTTRLAVFAQSRSDWLTDWAASAPHDPDAALVKAELAVRRAWERPGREGPLRETAPLIEAAAQATPRDPVPWRIALDQARGRHVSRAGFDVLWKEAVRRSAHHYGCHVAALRYLSAQVYGSHRECFDFAEKAAEQALPGSLLHALPLRAAFAVLLGREEDPDGSGAFGSAYSAASATSADSAGSSGSSDYSGSSDSSDSAKVLGDRIDAAADLAIGMSAHYEPGDPWPAEVRNLLAYVLIARGRWAEALDQFRLIGPCATAFPWSHVSNDPLGQFLELRDGVRIEVASTLPLRRRTGRAPASGH
ncbi:hypothetical protein ABZW18_24460 [Streptomyces sp. NPDC004647]|uniref:hypothetical protein n=1 Tax=Streptomyces sp. NPDC004647 TaxID=3154671 RepID=UPI0033B51449